jgi:hypothetical protein
LFLALRVRELGYYFLVWREQHPKYCAVFADLTAEETRDETVKNAKLRTRMRHSSVKENLLRESKAAAPAKAN